MEEQVVNYLNNNIHADVENKTIVITGGNSGVGFMSARIALYLKMNVIIACRNKMRMDKAVEELKEEFPGCDIKGMLLDVSEESSIKNFVNRLIDEHIDIDVFYHNAGVYRLPYELKEEKELIVSTNYYGPYILTALLLPYLYSLKHEVKMVITSSIAAIVGTNKVDMLEPSSKVSRAIRYSNSKLLDAHLFKYLYENDHQNVKYYLVHPGVTLTEIFSKTYKSKTFIKAARGFVKLTGNPLWKSALSIIRVLDEDSEPGLFYGPTRFFNWKGYPKVNHFLDKKYKITNDIILRTKEITGYTLIK